ncbi:MAG: NADH-quinone oxidoreductase subunit J [Syntrophomonadaceae bacterium]|jgi:NADH-quinone oxidoreductase subunit J|nr:NADH-quinone oxidoreductase subunit J [Syntrophomonadaceae bacterium]
MTLTLHDATFALLALLTLGAALGVVLARNIVHSAFLLVLTFLGVAGLFLTLDAGFLGLVQVLVYGGAISVLVVFAVMLLMSEQAGQTNPPGASRFTRWAGGVGAVALALALGAAVCTTAWEPGSGPRPEAVAELARLMLGDYVVPFEAAAVLLLLAVVGAIILAKGEDGR